MRCIKLKARNSRENFYDSCLLVLQQNLNKFNSLGSICTVRCGDVVIHSCYEICGNIKKTEHVLFHMILAINGDYMPKTARNVFFVRRKVHV